MSMTRTAAILATGPSMSQAIADALRMQPVTVIAVSDAYRLAPWADYIVSSDARWWQTHHAALECPAVKIGAMPDWQAIEGVKRFPGAQSGNNSGLLALDVAVHIGCKRICLFGIDLQGDHFFGPHPDPLPNTTAARFEVFQRQFARWTQPDGVEVINCSPRSKLTRFPFGAVEEALC